MIPGIKTTTVYHGTRLGGFREFSSKHIRSGIVGSNRSGGFYFTSSRENAAFFADAIEVIKGSESEWNDDDVSIYGEIGDYYFLLSDEINAGPYITEREAELVAKALVDKHNSADIGDIVFEDDRIISAYLDIKHPKIVHTVKDFRLAEEGARSEGYDAIIAVDITDGSESSTIYVVFRPDQIAIIG